MTRLILVGFIFIIMSCIQNDKNSLNLKPRILISTDIGGTDPDDNQSLIHFLMYSNIFETEGLISSPSYGKGAKEDIIEMIDLYEKDLPSLRKHASDFPTPEYLRSISKQGRRGTASYRGYQSKTEGSEWIIQCAKKESSQPLWVLVWGGLDDLAQALHDAPEIKDAIKVYWIGGPNKKWSTNSYAYLVENFPDLWMIEANATYRGFFSNSIAPDSLKNENYYDHFVNEAGNMGKAFKNYYKGHIKMGDTPSLLYVMNGELDNPLSESWGGSFEQIHQSPRYIFNEKTTLSDTVSVYSIVEYHLSGPEINISPDSACFRMTVHAGVGKQIWPGFYLGNGKYGIRYAPKKAETLTYEITSEIEGFPETSGQLIVENTWPGESKDSDYHLGPNWYSDLTDPSLFDNGWQGAKTVLKWRNAILLDWAIRWTWL
ncbi:nucleoside hydrolase-like domain-containing protein [Portibacter lacus]|uniref:DUF1593 domain-containing protein n=1 Tax=Portibacter lacus TaxID=1099794 RepID=A0AA37SU98_9BACT|nr:nucleoside hydrolase-like domain-containing protein [Portibacter lacus]GLR19834.1 hypothetical protein GCM10007940_44500 [Portibacter lacus]